jgi:hypothetical protein
MVFLFKPLDSYLASHTHLAIKYHGPVGVYLVDMFHDLGQRKKLSGSRTSISWRPGSFSSHE